MGRIVRFGPEPLRPQGGIALEAVGDGPEAGHLPQGGDTYLERVAKFIPAEVVAFFIFVNAILGDAAKTAIGQETDPASLKTALQGAAMGGFSVWTVAWAVVIIGMVMIPLYLLAVRDKDDPSEWVWLNIVMAVLAFPVWAYALDAVAFRPWHDGALAGIVLATFSFVSGAIAPSTIASIRSWFGRA